MKKLLIIFVRNLELGQVKKRLAADIGDVAALEIYEKLLERTFDVTKDLNCKKAVYYSGYIEKKDVWDRGDFLKKIQRGGDLGERMENAFSDEFMAGYEEVVLIGSDLYALQEKDIELAFSNLEDKELVIGPALDGGYYLLGKKRLNAHMFRNKNWGTDTVLKDTLKDLKKNEITLLEEKNDVDTIQDLENHPELQLKIDKPK